MASASFYDQSLVFKLPASLKEASTWYLIGGFFALTFLIYFKSLFHDFVRWDDGLLIYDNPAIWAITPQSLYAIFTSYDPELYIPLTFLSYQIDFFIGEFNPTIYHLTNLVLHTLNAILVVVFVSRLTGKRFIGVITGLLFAIHPLHTEAIAWASARKDLLSTLFFLASLSAYLKYRKSGQGYWWSLIAFTLALLAKVTVATLPAVLILIDWLKKRPLDKKAVLDKLPYFGLTILFGIIAVLGKTSVLEQSTLAEKIIMAGKSTVFYLEKLIAPDNLAVLYPYTEAITLTKADFWLPWLILVLLVVLAIASLKRTRLVCFGLLFYVGVITPTFLNFAKGANDFYIASDRYAYAGSIGILMLIAWLLWRAQSKWPRASLAALVTLIVSFSGLAHLQSRTWENTATLFSNVLKYSPNSYIAHNNLGNVYRRAGDSAAAKQSYLASLEARDHPRTRSNLGAVLRQLGDYSGAHEQYDLALAADPESKTAHFGLGILQATEGNFSAAEVSYLTALDLDPTYIEVALNLGSLYSQMERYNEAIAQFEYVLSVNPRFVQAHFNLGTVYDKVNRKRQAFESYKRAVEVAPDFVAARINLGLAYMIRQKYEEATEQLEAALRYDPGNKRATAALDQIKAATK